MRSIGKVCVVMEHRKGLEDYLFGVFTTEAAARREYGDPCDETTTFDVVPLWDDRERKVTVDEKKLRSTTDARVWAEEFAKVCPEVDQGLMIGWFANAIETGRWAEASAERAGRREP